MNKPNQSQYTYFQEGTKDSNSVALESKVANQSQFTSLREGVKSPVSNSASLGSKIIQHPLSSPYRRLIMDNSNKIELKN